MGDLFLKTLNMSIAASWLILAVVLLRFVLKKAPKWIAVLLWGIVALRLVVPFSFESALSLIPSAETIPEKVMSGPSFDVQTGIASVDNRINDYLGSHYFEGVTVPANNGANIMVILSTFWAIGIVSLIIYTAISYVRVRRSVAERAPYEENIFLCDHVKFPFILGLVRPKIYLPSSMDTTAMEPVIAHEKAHLARRDHWWKPLGFLILSVHWFNPLCWLAYVLLCRDIELACDEKVIRQMDLDGKKRYSTALLECNAQRRLVTICPLAFGEVGVKERVKNVLNYKKPAFWLIVAAIIACAVVTVCFATNPASAENYIRLQSTHSTPPAAFFSLDLAEGAHGTVIAGCWENGSCVSTNPVVMNNATQQIQLYLDPQDNGVNVQLGVDNGGTVLETFSYPEGEKPVGWSFVSLDEGGKTSLQFGKDRIIAAMAFDFGTGVKSYSCDTLSADKKQVEDAAYMIVIRAFLTNSDNSIDVPKVIETEPDSGEPAPEKPDVSTLSEEQAAIHQAILEHNKPSYPLEYDVACCSFITLETLSATPLAGSSTHKITYYGWALYEQYRATDNGLETTGGSHIPVALSFDLDERGYTLTEYWEPRDGSYNVPDIREKFPAHIVEDALHGQKFVLQQTQECYAQAIASTGLDTEKVIDLLLETICSSPALSSNPGDYIEAHPIEYRELTYYDRYTLKYCFTEFLKGGQTDLRGHIMKAAMDDIAPEAQLNFDAKTGQEYFDAWKDAAISVGEQHDMEWIEENQPAIYLLLSMLGEV